MLETCIAEVNEMMMTRIIVNLLIGVLLTLTACANPAKSPQPPASLITQQTPACTTNATSPSQLASGQPSPTLSIFDNLSVSRMIFSFLLSLIGLILISIGRKQKKRNVWTLGIAVALGGVLAIFVESPEIRTIILGIAAVFATIFSALSIQQSQKLRKENLERENRDRQERVLIEISQWAKDIIGCCREKAILGERRDTVSSRYEYDEIDNIRADLEVSQANGQYIQQVSGSFTGLVELVTMFIEHIREHVSLLEKQPIHPDMIAMGEWKIINNYLDQLHEQRIQLVTAGLRVLEEVGKLRSGTLHENQGS